MPEPRDDLVLALDELGERLDVPAGDPVAAARARRPAAPPPPPPQPGR
jgi:hypothetical protein